MDVKQYLHSFLILFTCFCGIGNTLTKLFNCGTFGGSCELECNHQTILGLNQNYDNNDTENGNTDYNKPSFPVCALQNLDYSTASGAMLDLSGKFLLLNFLPSDMQNLDYDRIRTMSLSGSVFHDFGNQSFLGGNRNGLPSFVKQFGNLEELDISNISAAGRSFVNWEGSSDFDNVWASHLDLKSLDFSENQNLWTLSSNAFQKMVNLRVLKMSECCPEIPTNPHFFRDLNNLEYLRISGNSWNSPPRTALFSMRKLEHLDMSRTNATFDPSRFFSRLSNLQVVLLNNLNENALDVSRLKFGSSKIRRLSLGENTLTGFDSRFKSFGLRNASALEELVLTDVKIEPQKATSNVLRELNGLKLLNISGSVNLLHELNSTLLQNNSNLMILDLSNLELWEQTGHNESNVFESLRKLEVLVMRNVTIYGCEKSTNRNVTYVTGGYEPRLSIIDLNSSTCKRCDFPWNSMMQLNNVSEINFSFSKNFSINSAEIIPIFPKLQKLNLTGGVFPVVDPSGFQNLRELDLSGIQVDDLKLSRLPKLEVLKFSNVSFLWELDGIYNSDINFDAFKIPELVNLTKLDFSNVHIDKLILKNFNKLADVQLFNASIREVFLENMTFLENLNLTSGSLDLWEQTGHNVSNVFESLRKLEVLVMRNVTIYGCEKSTNRNVTYVTGGYEPRLSIIDLNSSTCKRCDFPWNSMMQFNNVSEINFSFSKNFSINSAEIIPIFPKLQKLNLTGGVFSVVDPSGFQNLRELDLSGIQVDDLKLSRLPKLEALKFSNLSFLWELDGIYNSDINFDAFEIPELVNLTKLDFSHVHIDKLILKNFNKLTDVQLFNASIRELFLENISFLESLNLSSGSFSKIDLKSLTNLKNLDLSKAYFGNIQIMNSNCLAQLDLSFITQIDLIKQVNISQFIKLEKVNLSSCDLFDVPEVFSGLEFLETLDLSHNFLYLLPKSFIPETGRCSLVNLDLTDNFFEVLPQESVEQMISQDRAWEIKLANNLLNCSDCQNSWMTLENNSDHIREGFCQTPFDKHDHELRNVEICRKEEE